MIDIEDEVTHKVIDTVSDCFPFIHTYIGSLPVKPQFPCIVVEEIDNYAYDLTQDSMSLENHAIVTYETNVYSNKATDKKRECKQIQALADNEFIKMGFTRTSSISTTLNNSTIYRIVSRYTACVSKNGEIYRR